MVCHPTSCFKLFSTHKEVDLDRIGAKGYSYGGTIMWNLGMDERVKAIVSYFSWNEYYRSRHVWLYNNPYVEPQKTPGESLYLKMVAPQSHVPHIKAATLWLNGTNDHHGGYERADLTFAMFADDVPWSFALRPRGHHNTEGINQDAKLWLEKYVLNKDIFWPDQAKVKIDLDANGIPQFTCTPKSPERIKKVSIYYSQKTPVSFGRAWRDSISKRVDDEWIASLPVMNTKDDVFAFANIEYDNTVVISTSFEAKIPSKLGNAIATDKPSEKLTEETCQWLNVAPAEGLKGVRGFRVLYKNRGTITAEFSDPRYQAPEGKQLMFDFYCTQPQKIIFKANDHFQKIINISASNEWQSMVLQSNEIINRHNQYPLSSWDQVKKVGLNSLDGYDITQIVFANFRWVDANQN